MARNDLKWEKCSYGHLEMRLLNDLKYEKSQQGQYKEIPCLTAFIESTIPVKEQGGIALYFRICLQSVGWHNSSHPT